MVRRDMALWLGPDLAFLELFPILVSVELWGTTLRNRRVVFHCDNMGVVMAVNNLTASSPPVVRLLRSLVLRCLDYNITFRAVHIPGVHNITADALSRSQWEVFRAVAPQADLEGIPCPAELWNLGLGAVTARLSGLSFWFLATGLRDVTKEFSVRQAMKGWRRGHRSVDARKPVSGALLLGLVHVLPAVCRSPFEISLFRLAFSLAFFGALRIGELVSPATRVAGGLLAADMVREPGFLRFVIRRSKTDMLGKGTWVTLREVPGSTVCPVSCFDQFCSGRPVGSLSLLVHADSSSLSRFQFIQVFRLAVEALGLPGSEFGGHSFRIGAASEAARLGYAERAIKQIGRWESRRFLSYVRPQGLTSVSSALQLQMQRLGGCGS
ncbi:uncharacterized protein RCH25_036532 [Pelodytes ibericus]